MSNTETALILPEETSLIAMFKTDDGLDPIIKELEKRVREEADLLDVTTKKGREGFRSLAFRVSQSKAELERQAKSMTEAARKEVEVVNKTKRSAVTALEDLRDEMRGTAEKWEAEEEARIAGHKNRLLAFDLNRVDMQSDPDFIRAVIQEIEAIPVTEEAWQEYAGVAAEYQSAALTKWRNDLQAAQKRVDDAAELERLREAQRRREEQEAERNRQEIAEREARERHERDAAERKAAQERIAAAQRQRDAAAAADRERAARQAREQAEADARADKKRHARELREAEERAENARQEERDRITREQAEKEKGEAQRLADAAIASRIIGEIQSELSKIMAFATDPDDCAEAIANAIYEGEIPHTKVTT